MSLQGSLLERRFPHLGSGDSSCLFSELFTLPTSSGDATVFAMIVAGVGFVKRMPIDAMRQIALILSVILNHIRLIHPLSMIDMDTGFLPAVRYAQHLVLRNALSLLVELPDNRSMATGLTVSLNVEPRATFGEWAFPYLTSVVINDIAGEETSGIIVSNDARLGQVFVIIPSVIVFAAPSTGYYFACALFVKCANLRTVEAILNDTGVTMSQPSSVVLPAPTPTHLFSIAFRDRACHVGDDTRVSKGVAA